MFDKSRRNPLGFRRPFLDINGGDDSFRKGKPVGPLF